MTDQRDVVCWSTFEDYNADKILSDEDGSMVIQYCGQTSGRRDNLIFKAKFFVGGKKGARKLLGEVLSVAETDKKETRMFIIVLKKFNSEQPVIKTKNGLCQHYGWSNCDDHIQGITRHTKLTV